MDGAIAISRGVELFVRAGAQRLTRYQLERINQSAVGVGDRAADGVIHGIVNHTLGVLNGNGYRQGGEG